MNLTCVAVDDEPLALDIIKDYLEKMPFVSLLKTFTNPIESIDFMKNNSVDLLFLDIHMRELSGIQLLNSLKNCPLVIFTTAYDKYALESYDLDVVDYLLKPISFERLLKAVDKAYDRKMLLSANSNFKNEYFAGDRRENFFFVKTESRLQKINYSDILYIEGMGDYLKIITTGGKIITLMNFKGIEELLQPELFCRVHKSYIVALDKIISIERNRIKIGDQIIPISDFYSKSFFSLLKKRKLI